MSSSRMISDIEITNHFESLVDKEEEIRIIYLETMCLLKRTLSEEAFKLFIKDYWYYLSSIIAE